MRFCNNCLIPYNNKGKYCNECKKGFDILIHDMAEYALKNINGAWR